MTLYDISSKVRFSSNLSGFVVFTTIYNSLIIGVFLVTLIFIPPGL